MSTCLVCRSEPARPLRGSVRALYCSTACRSRHHDTRRTARRQRQEQLVQSRLAMARTDRERALAHWDALRALIGRLPRRYQEAAWRFVARQLQTIYSRYDREDDTYGEESA